MAGDLAGDPICFDNTINYNPWPRLQSNHGWICPRCNKVYAPFVQSCYGCNNTNTVTWQYGPANPRWAGALIPCSTSSVP